MFIERVHSHGLAHISYFVGAGGKAAVIDPRRDCQAYSRIARREGLRITHIFETHRNEDYVIGSRELANLVSARIYHGAGLPFHYGKTLSEGDTFDLGHLRFGILDTPGHSAESISITVADLSSSEDPVAVFTGDTLFVSDVGRTDLMPQGPEFAAGLLYDSIFSKLLPLGDHVIIYPAHSAGSVCGLHMSAREFSTLGYERLHNPALALTDRDEFVAHKVAEHHYRPPYFRRMEEQNLEGPDLLEELPDPCACTADEFAKHMQGGAFIIDLRGPESFGGAHIPGTLAIPLDMIPTFAGWFLPYDTPLGIVVEHTHDVETAVRYLVRLGYDSIETYLGDGMTDWETGGRHFEGIPQVYIGEINRRLQEKVDFVILDVRTESEFAQAHLEGAKHIYVGELPGRLDEVPRDKTITTFCGTGHRAIIAASILKRSGFRHVENCLGSMAACRAAGCPLTESG